MEWSELEALFPDFPDADRWIPRLKRHAALLAGAAAHTRVTAVREEDIVRRHYAESLEIWRIAQAAMSSAGRVIDVGSGGGFPGLVLASVAPTTEVVLIEPLQKRARLLQEMAGELALANVTVLPVRAEEAGQSPLRESADIVTARAVAPLPELLEYTAPMARVGGVLVLPKGSGLDAELEAAHHAEEVLGVEFRGTHAMRPEISETLVIALFAKVSQTPAAYPRRPGVAAKRPL